MRKELEHFYIDGSYGGNQDWFRTFMMRIGGCGAETACDSSLYFAIHKGIENIYPFDRDALSKQDYVDFAHMMEEYLKPRMSGINRPDGTDDMKVKAVTYSGYQWLDLRELWDTGYDSKGGLVLYEKA